MLIMSEVGLPKRHCILSWLCRTSLVPTPRAQRVGSGNETSAELVWRSQTRANEQCSSYSSLYCWPWQPVVPVTCCGILVQLFQVKPAVHWAVWNHLCCEFAMCASAMWLIRTIYALHVVCSNGNLLYKNYIYKSTLVSELDPQIIEKGGGSSS